MLKTILERASEYSALVVGDEIIDEYVYVKPQGKSPKENIITYRVLNRERFQGGVTAAAAHARNFCARVDIASGPDRIIKRRSVESERMLKLHEEHEIERGPGCFDLPYEEYDLTIVTDFGHGCVTSAMIEDMTANANYLCVNAQTNSANHGFNLITKYPRADFVVIDELEARLAAHDRDSPLEEVIESLHFSKIIITLGQHGSIGYDSGKFHRAPAVSSNVVDTMGAGDAFFCVTALLAAAGADIETLCRVGNAAGAIKCGVVGHREAVTVNSLLEVLA